MSEKFRWLGRSSDGEEVILRRFRGDFAVPQDEPEPAIRDLFDAKQSSFLTSDQERRLAVVDVETTGLSWERDAIIEIGLREVVVDAKSGRLLRVGEHYQGFADPGRPIPPEITRLTGITDADVAGKVIDWAAVGQIIGRAHLVVAHNASFDRPFIELKVPEARKVIWGCSLDQVDWAAHGFPARKLEILAIFHGFFVDAHRALEDVDALIHLLSFPTPETENAYFHELVERANTPMVHVIASNSPFESKDVLRARGYYWDSRNRYWHRKLPADKTETEVDWLKESVYRGSFRGEVREIPLSRNFSAG